MAFNFCPQCAQPLLTRELDSVPRMACSDQACTYVHWDNPVPVVAAVVEHEGEIILARNRAWPVPFYALITGFLEKSDPSPEEAIAREVMEELGLEAQGTHFIGHYAFPRQNQIIIAYHVPATGVITLGDELVDYKRIAPARARYWPSSTGLALRDWLVTQGHSPQAMDLPKL
ncbi:MAG: NUDIX domain-containing protein [Rubrivivax sp.]|nr:MAG: NUDIX domain-containing protein [Rubrivivax sp.]